MQLVIPNLVVSYVLLVTQLSNSALGQSNFFSGSSDYDYADFSGFRAVASPAILPVQRPRDSSLARQFQAVPQGQVPIEDGSRRQQAGRGEAVPQEVRQREEPKVVNILKQINEYV